MFYYLKKDKKRVFILSIVIIIRQLLLVYNMTINARGLNALVNFDFEEFIKQNVYLVILWTVIIVMDIIIKISKENIIQDLIIEIKQTISNYLRNQNYREYHKNSEGKYLSWLNNDMKLIENKGFNQFFNIIQGVSGMIFAVVSLFMYHWSLTIVVAVGAGMMMLVPKMFSSKIKRTSQALAQSNAEYVEEVEDTLHGFNVFFGLNIMTRLPKKIYKAAMALKSSIMDQTKIEAFSFSVGFAINVLSQIGITFYTGILAFNQIVLIGAVEATGGLTDIIFNALNQLSNQITLISGVETIFDKFKGMESEENVEKKSTHQNEKILESRKKCVFKGVNVGFSYGEKEIFSCLNFEIEKHKKYLIKGPSGCGKSTFLKVLASYLQTYEGDIQYFGQQLSVIPSHIIRDQIMYIDQTPYLFNQTVRENISLGDKFTDEAIVDSLVRAGFSENRANELIDYQVSGNGKNLSGGQKQRITLARGLIRNKHILLMDESTSAIDQKTALEVQERILALPELTVMMISHQTSEDVRKLFDEVINFPNDLI
ncbi:ATP-binding cassette domain-containing protein [Dolosigranulum pigrum]|uniref:ATP-binding cassette domain-containing protein n=1 Tax=Dolosigranulum pigrum TaxID=29394 RepID=UPI001AD88D20|nr:ABC transporter ATP-binding protein [Dolosigranulum pigrum]QTJ56709.1 ABC transporter ATP-binding protein [Dolosigranulum pigrum]